MDYPNILSKTILDEIESLPGEFREKSEEVRNLQKELNELKTNYNNKENTLNKLTKEIISLENDLVYNYDEVNNFKSEQKIIITELDEEAFNLFRNNFYKLDEEYYKKILCFLKYENDFEDLSDPDGQYRTDQISVALFVRFGKSRHFMNVKGRYGR